MKSNLFFVLIYKYMAIKIIKWIGDKMKNRKKSIIIFFLILIFLSCGKKENTKNESENKNNIGQIEEQMITFKDKSIEKVINDFEVNSKKNKIEINKFENLKYENQNFYKAEIITKEDSNYTISYQGIDIKGLALKVGTVSNSDLGIIEDMVVNLIEVSDKRIIEDEARILYAQLLSDIKDDKLSNSIKYKNGITYAIQVERTGVLIFSAQ